MSSYKIRVQIEMIPCDDAPTHEPMIEHDGSLSIVLSEADAIMIDACEQGPLTDNLSQAARGTGDPCKRSLKKKPVSGRGRGHW